ncbi:MAG: hypothetical protein AAF843_03730 [Bacteroidota bacterium]
MKNYITIFFLILNVITKAQKKQELPIALKEFMYTDAQFPFGKKNDRAPKELEDFGRLTGVWEMTSEKLWQGTWYKCCQALWAFKYSVDGYAIEDYWFRYKENHPPVGSNRDVDFHGLNLRFYDVKNQEWRMTWVDNLGAFNYYKAKSEKDEVRMFPDEEDPDHKIIFKNITANSFEWNMQQRDEKGQWNLVSKSFGVRRDMD